MARQTPTVASLAMSIDRAAAEPLNRQLYTQVREVILAGRLAPGALLPSTRSLMRELGLSRTTVVAAFEQLHSEGYIEGRVGAGTYVASVLPESLLEADRRPDAAAPPRHAAPRVSRRAEGLARVARPRLHGERAPLRAFRPGVPDTDRFPFDVWSRLYARFWRRPPRDLLSASYPAGYPPLRAAIADYLRSVRALACRDHNVIVMPGALNAVDLVARTLLDPGDRVWVEEPGYPSARAPVAAAGAEQVPVRVDIEGIDVARGAALAPDARLAMVTPSRQFPLGHTLSLARRLALLDWAKSADAWLLEDDYDAEYRYSGHPVASLQGLDDSGRVIYVGTFSKVLFPALRIAYLVVPDSLVDAFVGVRAALDDQPSIAIQPPLTEFIESGQFASHVRRMRGLYAERQALLLDALARHLGERLLVGPEPAGMHLLARLPRPANDARDQRLSARAAAAGVAAPPLSAFYVGDRAAQGLLLGYAGFEAEEMEMAAGRLAEVFREDEAATGGPRGDGRHDPAPPGVADGAGPRLDPATGGRAGGG